MGYSNDSRTTLRGIIYENLYLLQEGMCEFRKTHDRQGFQNCLRSVFGEIADSAEGLGFREISTIAYGIIDCCERAGWKITGPCREMISVFNRTIDWMLGQITPRQDYVMGLNNDTTVTVHPDKMVREFNELVNGMAAREDLIAS